MPTPIKYSTTNTTLPTLRKGNLALGVSGEGYNSTYNSGMDVPVGGYVVYSLGLNNNPNIHVANNDSELILISNELGASVDTVEKSLEFLSGRDNTWILDEAPDNKVTDGLVLDLSSDNITSYPGSGNVWVDLSGNGNDGALINSPTFNFIKSLDFDGVNDTINIGNNGGVNLSDNFTFSLLVKSTNWVSHNQEGLVQKGSLNYYGAYLRGNGGDISFYTKDNYWAPGPSIGGDGKWHYLTFIYSYSELGFKQVYLDGEYVNQKSLTIPIPTNSSNITLGYASVNSPQFFSGEVVKYKLYNKVLTQKEILQNYHQAPIVTDGLVLALDAGNLVSYESGSTTTHSLTGSIDGTLYNGVDYSESGGGCFDFDGVDDGVKLITGLDLSTKPSMTISAWVKVTTGGSWFRWFSGSDNTSFHRPDLAILSNGDLGYHFTNLSTGWVDTNKPIPLNTWVNITFTFTTSGEVGIYLDGESEYTNTHSSGTLPSNYNIMLGNRYDLNGEAITGKIATNKIYDRALSPEEVAQNYNAQKTRFI
jgi:hypothetical protein